MTRGTLPAIGTNSRADGQLTHAEPEGHAQVQQAVDDPASRGLQTCRHGGRDEDICDVEGNVHANRPADHGREDVRPVQKGDGGGLLTRRRRSGSLGYECEEENRDEEADLRDDEEEAIGQDVKYETTSYCEDDTSYR